jgi:hypothetical protein
VFRKRVKVELAYIFFSSAGLDFGKIGRFGGYESKDIQRIPLHAASFSHSRLLVNGTAIRAGAKCLGSHVPCGIVSEARMKSANRATGRRDAIPVDFMLTLFLVEASSSGE